MRKKRMKKTTMRRKSNKNIVNHSNVCFENEKQKSCSARTLLPLIFLSTVTLGPGTFGSFIGESVLEGMVPA